MLSMVLLMHDVFPVQYMFYQMGATDINKKLTSAMLLIIWMCVVTVLNGSKYVKNKKKNKTKKTYIFFRDSWTKLRKIQFQWKKKSKFLYKKIKSIATINMSNLSL